MRTLTLFTVAASKFDGLLKEKVDGDRYVFNSEGVIYPWTDINSQMVHGST